MTYLAKAYVMRLLVVMIVVVANSRQMRGNLGKGLAQSSRSSVERKIVHEQADRTGFAPSSFVEDSQQWTSSGFNDILHIC